MHYRDLFQLNPIQTVIKLEDSNAKATALELVQRFVVTPSLQDMLQRVALPELSKSAVEGKGIFVVGHYGTGKSHVMSFLSALAEHSDAVQRLRPSPQVKPEQYAAFAGQFLVRRTQISASLMSLYAIVAKELTDLAAQHGVAFVFAPQNQIVNAKNELARYMAALEPVLQGRGVLFAVDELLHYLESRNDQDLVIDLQMLQGLGEFCDGHRFVFMAGLQRSLFQHPRFHGIAAELTKVRQRFNDFLIDNKGVAELIEGYLFAKTPEQAAQIRRLLLPHKDLFETLGPDIDRFVALFPAHPLFLDEFSQVAVVERREILTVLSVEGARLAANEVDPQWPELITADRYWQHVAADAGLDANHAVQKVKHNAQVLAAKIAESGLGVVEQAVALRLVAALAVNRLTTPGISDAVGLTPEALKNRLLPRLKLPMRDAKMLTGMVKRLLEKTREAANFQFMTTTPDGAQYYIDPNIIDDFEAHVRSDAKTTDRRKVQAYFNQLLLQQLELENAQPAKDGTLWNYRLLWRACNVERPGWLFFGVPGQRSTAKPPKDFYLFVLPSPRISGTVEPEALMQPEDEVYFVADGFPTARRELDEAQQPDAPETFLDRLWLYAAAKERAALNAKVSQAHKALTDIAKRYFDQLRADLDQHLGQWLRVRHGGLTRSLHEWMIDRLPGEARAAFSTQFSSLAEHLLTSHFGDRYPRYPVFSVRIAEPDDAGRGGRNGAAQSALEMICEQGAGISGTQEGRAVLKALGLTPAGVADAKPADIDPVDSPWLQMVKARLAALNRGQFLNAGDLFEQRIDQRWFMVDGPLEAEWLHVVLAAGVRSGELQLSGDHDRRYNASNLPKLYSEVRTFDRVVRVSVTIEFPAEAWAKVFGILGLQKGLLATDATRDEAARKLFDSVTERSTAALDLRQRLQQPLPMASGLTPPLVMDLANLDAAHKTLEDLKVYTTKAKMINLRLTLAQIDEFGAQLAHVAALQALADFARDHGPRLAAVERLLTMLQARAPEFEDGAQALRQHLLQVYLAPGEFAAQSETLVLAARQTSLLGCRSYRALHKHRRLTRDQDQEKQRLIVSRTWKQLRGLTGLRLLEGASAFDQIANGVERLRLFRDYTDEQLLANPATQAPQDPFDPRQEPADAAADELARYATQVEVLLADWVERLLAELGDPSVQQSKKALKPEEFSVVAEFESSRVLPDPGPQLTLLVQVLNTLLEGLKKVDVNAEDLAAALLDAKSPLKVGEVEQRFRAWLREMVGHDQEDRVRLSLVSTTPEQVQVKHG
jgi:hypothetical protein